MKKTGEHRMEQGEAFRIFAKVSELGSISGAARALGLPKASVSRTVSRLEVDLGVSLLDRNGHRVRLTEIGLMFKNRCLRVLEEIEEAEVEVANYTGSLSGVLRIGCAGDVSRGTLEPYLAEFLGRYPTIDLRIQVGERLIPEPNGLDLVLYSGWLSDSNFIARKIGAALTLLVASRTYVESRGFPTSIDALRGHDIIGNFYADRAANDVGQLPAHVPVLEVVRDGVRHALPIWPRFASTDHALIISVVRRGLAIAPVAAHRIVDELRSGEMVRVLPKYRIFSPPTLYAIYSKRRALTPKVVAFLEFLNEKIAQETLRIRAVRDSISSNPRRT